MSQQAHRYEYQHPERFLGLPDTLSSAANSAVYILPLPLEQTTSYIGGTKRGPAALIEASQQVEWYDFEFDAEPVVSYGVHTLPTLHPTLESPHAAFESIRQAVTDLLPTLGDKLLFSFGGEHSLTPAVVAALVTKHPDLIMVQIDAHSDLRDEYEGTPYSHACTARRTLDYAPVIQFGIRSSSAEEIAFARQTDRVQIVRADVMHADTAKRYLETARAAVAGRPVYLTIDVDGLDPSLIRATGTPEPGGIGWYDCLALIKTVADSGRIVGADCVELSPYDGEQASAFTAAKLVYKTMTYVMRQLLMTTNPIEHKRQKYTADDLLAMPDDGKRYELINGEIVQVGASSEKHSTLGAWLVGMLFVYLNMTKLGGRLKGADGTYDLDEENTKAPDVSYLTPPSAAKVSPNTVFCPFGPDFAIEIKSPSDTITFMRWLAGLYIRTGTQLVWTIDPAEKTAKIYRRGQAQAEEVDGDAVLDASEVIPGFKISLTEMFAQIEGL